MRLGLLRYCILGLLLALSLSLVVPARGTPVEAQENHSAFRGNIEYVALGDSYSAGEGVFPYTEDTDTNTNSCHRTETGAYPDLMADWLETVRADGSHGDPGALVNFMHLACSGAEAPNLFEGSFNSEPPQMASPILRTADLVTITIGGNDAKFSSILSDCAALVPDVDCSSRVASWPGSDPDFQALQGATTAELVPLLFERLQRRLKDLYVRLRVAAPHASVYVLGYPNLFPETEPEQDCAKLSLGRYRSIAGIPVDLGRLFPPQAEPLLAGVAVQPG